MTDTVRASLVIDAVAFNAEDYDKEIDKISKNGENDGEEEEDAEYNNLIAKFDLKCSIFEGRFLPRKFIRNTEYQIRFFWVSLRTRTIDMSHFDQKERKHKEAALSDVTSIVRGSPQLEDIDTVNPKLSMTINFQEGSGVDLRYVKLNFKRFQYASSTISMNFWK